MQKLIKKRLSQVKLLFKKLKLIQQKINLNLINNQIKKHEKTFEKLSSKDSFYSDYKLQSKISKIIIKLFKIQKKLQNYQVRLGSCNNNQSLSKEDMLLLEKYKTLEKDVNYLKNINDLVPDLKKAFRDNNVYIPQDTRKNVNEEVNFQP